MQLKSVYNALTQAAKTGDSIKSESCSYLTVVFDTPVSAPTIKIYGTTRHGLTVILHTEAALAANKIVDISNAGAFETIYAVIDTVASDTCKVELLAVFKFEGQS